MFTWIGQFFMNNLQAFLPLARTLLIFFTFRTFLDCLIPCFPWLSFRETITSLEGLTFTRPTFLSLGLRYHCGLLSCKFSVMLSNFSQTLSRLTEIIL